MSTYYRKLDPKECSQAGDGRIVDGNFIPYSVEICTGITHAQAGGAPFWRPVNITEAKPQPPAHRVEDETWETGISSERVHVKKGSGPDEWVCYSPESNHPGAKRWPQRAKRICAGQEALKFLERYQNEHCWPRVEEVDRILAMLKEGK